jgi:hypothetical protein
VFVLFYFFKVTLGPYDPATLEAKSMLELFSDRRKA